MSGVCAILLPSMTGEGGPAEPGRMRAAGAEALIRRASRATFSRMREKEEGRAP